MHLGSRGTIQLLESSLPLTGFMSCTTNWWRIMFCMYGTGYVHLQSTSTVVFAVALGPSPHGTHRCFWSGTGSAGTLLQERSPPCAPATNVSISTIVQSN